MGNIHSGVRWADPYGSMGRDPGFGNSFGDPFTMPGMQGVPGMRGGTPADYRRGRRGTMPQAGGQGMTDPFPTRLNGGGANPFQGYRPVGGGGANPFQDPMMGGGANPLQPGRRFGRRNNPFRNPTMSGGANPFQQGISGGQGGLDPMSMMGGQGQGPPDLMMSMMGGQGQGQLNPMMSKMNPMGGGGGGFGGGGFGGGGYGGGGM
ncbi:hypothetical protein LTR37_005593 [Vermiconidia calcicola]|uniref:Uncharacterized protein n=1 Tax=Vermiconidia calcicola TaxID=1690605 RepID=A0ACC3NJB7_9PEZI|nr:hypothetical protein LTR37_005593 [Vermiconidia calcicola]